MWKLSLCFAEPMRLKQTNKKQRCSKYHDERDACETIHKEAIYSRLVFVTAITRRGIRVVR